MKMWGCCRPIALLGLALTVGSTGFSEGTASLFQGVEKWHGRVDTHLTINAAGRTKVREISAKFTLEKHRAAGAVESWEGRIAGRNSDADSDGVFSGTVVGGANALLKLVLDLSGDEAELTVHVPAGKRKMAMKVMGQTMQTMVYPQPAQTDTYRTTIAEDAERIVFIQDQVSTFVRMNTVLTLTPEDVPLKAVLVAGSAVRGDKARLDASKSKGRIRTFTWTLRPQGTSGAPTVKFDTRERTVELVLLEDVHVDLEISNGRKTARTSGIAKVAARDWKTSFKQETDDGVLEGEQLVSPEAVPNAENRFGQNACAIEGRDSAHGMHATVPGTWNDDPLAGYTTQVVVDPERPFDGYWYVASQALIVRRRALFNPDLMPGSVLFAENARRRTGAMWTRLVASCRAHEYMHGELMHRELLRDDPARRIERLAKRDPDELATFADMEIRETETRIQEGQFHEREVRTALRKKFGKGGTVWVRDGRGGFASWTLSSFADKGH